MRVTASASGSLPESVKVPVQPKTFAEALDAVAKWMDATEKVLVRRGEIGAVSDGAVQAGLRRAARSLRQDPTLDDLMMDAMLHGPDFDEEN